MVKEITVSVEIHDHASSFLRGISGILGNFPDQMVLPPEFGHNFTESVAFKGRDGKVHVVLLPSADLMAAVIGAVDKIKRLDGSSIKPRPLPHEAVREDDGA